jgi:antitoxin component of RelBE/YafQ-DinJ toxin-antitoxin module
MDKHHLQIRMSAQTKKELREASKRLGLPASDIVRGALFFGLPIVVAMNELQDEIVKRLVRKLKGEARLRRSR